MQLKKRLSLHFLSVALFKYSFSQLTEFFDVAIFQFLFLCRMVKPLIKLLCISILQMSRSLISVNLLGWGETCKMLLATIEMGFE